MEIPSHFFEIRDKIVSCFYDSLDPEHKQTILQEAKSGFLTLLRDDDFLGINNDGTIGDDGTSGLTESYFQEVDSVAVTFYYEFGGGHIKAKKGDPPHVPSWSSPMPGDIKVWEKKLSASLKTVSSKFSKPDLEYDGDFGLQGIIIKLTKDDS